MSDLFTLARGNIRISVERSALIDCVNGYEVTLTVEDKDFGHLTRIAISSLEAQLVARAVLERAGAVKDEGDDR